MLQAYIVIRVSILNGSKWWLFYWQVQAYTLHDICVFEKDKKHNVFQMLSPNTNTHTIHTFL
jgi:hypothetical protein